MYKTSDVFDILKADTYKVFAVLDEDSDVEACFNVKASSIDGAIKQARAVLKQQYDSIKPGLIDEMFDDPIEDLTNSTKATFGSVYPYGASVELSSPEDAYKEQVFDKGFDRYKDV